MDIMEKKVWLKKSVLLEQQLYNCIILKHFVAIV